MLSCTWKQEAKQDLYVWTEHLQEGCKLICRCFPALLRDSDLSGGTSCLQHNPLSFKRRITGHKGERDEEGEGESGSRGMSGEEGGVMGE